MALINLPPYIPAALFEYLIFGPKIYPVTPQFNNINRLSDNCTTRIQAPLIETHQTDPVASRYIQEVNDKLFYHAEMSKNSALWVSDDKGLTWQWPIGTMFNYYNLYYNISPVAYINSNYVIVATGAVFISDSGYSWTLIPVPTPINVNYVSSLLTIGSELVFINNVTLQIFQSIDGGYTWLLSGDRSMPSFGLYNYNPAEHDTLMDENGIIYQIPSVVSDEGAYIYDTFRFAWSNDGMETWYYPTAHGLNVFDGWVYAYGLVDQSVVTVLKKVSPNRFFTLTNSDKGDDASFVQRDLDINYNPICSYNHLLYDRVHKVTLGSYDKLTWHVMPKLLDVFILNNNFDPCSGANAFGDPRDGYEYGIATHSTLDYRIGLYENLIFESTDQGLWNLIASTLENDPFDHVLNINDTFYLFKGEQEFVAPVYSCGTSGNWVPVNNVTAPAFTVNALNTSDWFARPLVYPETVPLVGPGGGIFMIGTAYDYSVSVDGNVFMLIIFKSTDNMQTWTLVNTDRRVLIYTSCMYGMTDGELFVFYTGNGSEKFVAKTTDGNTWSTIPQEYVENFDTWDQTTWEYMIRDINGRVIAVSHDKIAWTITYDYNGNGSGCGNGVSGGGGGGGGE